MLAEASPLAHISKSRLTQKQLTYVAGKHIAAKILCCAVADIDGSNCLHRPDVPQLSCSSLVLSLRNMSKQMLPIYRWSGVQ
jgi:hypothetical protein